MTVIASNIQPGSDLFQANAALNQKLANQLRERTAHAALGGPKSARDRHEARGKLLPRQRVERLLDPGAPFLEMGALAAYDLYEGEAPGAGIITGIGRVSGREVMIVAYDATV
jgi:3-methylcrotonyl-CoA carboxylase beta subunit